MSDRSDPRPPGSAAFDNLAAMVEDAKRGELRFPPPPAQSDADTGSLPASWYRRDVAPRPNFTFDMLRATAVGAVLGLFVLAPLAWWQGGPAKPLTPQGEPNTALSLVALNARDVAVSTSLAPQDRMRALIELARVRIMAGDVIAARTLLSRADVARDADALFLMAETYDPRRLEAWGVRRTEPDVARARALYAAANALGHAEADARLAGLD